MKKVILIGGTSYSGSTMLDMILGNEDDAFSCGEIYNLFQPTRTHHINPVCGCGDRNCTIWKKAYKAGENSFVKHLFESNPSLNTIVISSKNIPWIYEQNQNLRKQGFEVINVLIWKSPLDFAYAMQKRGKYQHWERIWINYHRVYFNLIKQFYPVSYEKLVSDSNELERLCFNLGLKYRLEKRNYWDKTHHTLFGNTTAKYHLYAKNSEIIKEEEKEIMAKTNYSSQELKKQYRSLYRNAPPEEFQLAFIIKNAKLITSILNYFSTLNALRELKISTLNCYKIIGAYKLRKLQRKWRLVKLTNVKNF